MMRFHRRVAVLVAALAAAAALGPTASIAEDVPRAPDIDPAAKAALEQMGAYLRTLKVFQVEAATEREEVLDNGLKAQWEGNTTLLARAPDRMLVDVESDRQERQYLYDGKTFTLWAPRVGYYATVPAPPTIRELAETLETRYGIEMPLVDLFRWGAASEGGDAITAAVDLGPGTIAGTTCEHYAFRQEGLDWQIWIQKGEYPLPRKLVLTTTDDEARPQFQATYTWNLAPSFNDATFVFDAPADAHKIELTPASGDGN